LRERGAHGSEIINKLKENSATFNLKTQFSKEKWLKRKQQKYMAIFEVKKPTALEVCEAYHRNNPERLCGIRPDSLSYLLTMANISSQSRVLLVDNTRGFLAGALMEKEVAYALRVEFNTRFIKNTNDVLFEMDLPSNLNKRVGTINSKLLVHSSADGPSEKDDPMLGIMKKQFKGSFSSLIFLHDELHPKEVY
jgi:tRNA (adenine-N(1)-)-methyltransferase non-catalytic subunit